MGAICSSNGAAIRYQIKYPARVKIARPGRLRLRWLRLRWQRSRLLERITEGARDHPRPQRCLRGDELLRADEGARVRVTEVLAGQCEAPCVLRDADCRVI